MAELSSKREKIKLFTAASQKETKVTDMVIWENITRSSFSVDFELLFDGDRQEKQGHFYKKTIALCLEIERD